MEDIEWKKQEGANIWVPEKENESLEGEIVVVNPDGLYGIQYTVKKSDGEKLRTPSHKVLQSRMQEAKVGTKVKIVFTGTEPAKIAGQNPMTMYDVFFEE